MFQVIDESTHEVVEEFGIFDDAAQFAENLNYSTEMNIHSPDWGIVEPEDFHHFCVLDTCDEYEK